MRDSLRNLLHQKLPAPLEDTLERMLALDRFEQLYEEAGRIADGDSLVQRFLRLLNVKPKISAQDMALIPKRARW